MVGDEQPITGLGELQVGERLFFAGRSQQTQGRARYGSEGSRLLGCVKHERR